MAQLKSGNGNPFQSLVEVIEKYSYAEYISIAVSDLYLVVITVKIVDLNLKREACVMVFDKEGKKIRSFGSGDGKFKIPSGVAISQNDHILVVDKDGDCIQKFTMEGTFVATAGTRGKGELEFKSPQGISVLPDGLILVADTDNNRIQALNPDLSFSHNIYLLHPTESKVTPTSLAVDCQGMLYIAHDDMVIQKYTPTGQFLTEFAVIDPIGIAIDKSDTVYVGCERHGCVLAFDTNGKFRAKMGENLKYLEGLALDKADGKLYVSHSTEVLVTSSDFKVPVMECIIPDTPGRPKPSSPRPLVRKLAKVKHGSDVAISKDGNTIAVVECKNHSVILFNKEGKRVRSFGSRGSANDQFNSPSGVAITHDNHIIVADERNHRIVKFTMEGEFVASVGEEGSGELQFNLPEHISILPSGLIMVADSGNDRIQVLKPDLSFSHSYPFADGDEPGEFDGLYDMAVDSRGMLYVTDFDGNRVQKFSSEGQFIMEIGRRMLKEPQAIAVDVLTDTVYVGDDNDISMFDTSGKLKWRFGKGTIKGLAVDNTGSLYFCVYDGIYVSVPASSIPRPITSGGDSLNIVGLGQPTCVAISSDNRVALGEYDDSRFKAITVLDMEGEVIKRFDGAGMPNNNKFIVPSGLAFTPDNNIIITDAINNSIQKFTMEGEFLAIVGSEGEDKLQFKSPEGVCIHPNGKIFVVDTDNHRIQILNSDFSLSHIIGSDDCDSGSKPGEFDRPSYVDYDSQGMVYITDTKNDRIQKFTPDGQFITYFGSNIHTEHPAAIAIDRQADIVYVCSTTDGHISIFNTSGLFLASFGSNFMGAAVDKTGKLYASDFINKKFVVYPSF